MAHPYQHQREHHVERERVGRIAGHHEGHRDYEDTYHRADGGRIPHLDAEEDARLIRKTVKPSALRAHGGKAKAHPGKAHRAKGGRVKKNKGTVVNVNVAPQQPQHPPMIAPPPAAAAPPAPPPRPPMGPPPGGPPGMPPGGPPMMGPRAMGGRIGYKKGGSVEAPCAGSDHPRPAVPKKMHSMGRKTGGPVEPHLKQGVGMGPSGNAMPKGKPVKLGKDAIYAPATGDMGPTSGTGTGGAVARLEMTRRAARHYHKTPPARHTP